MQFQAASILVSCFCGIWIPWKPRLLKLFFNFYLFFKKIIKHESSTQLVLGSVVGPRNAEMN